MHGTPGDVKCDPGRQGRRPDRRSSPRPRLPARSRPRAADGNAAGKCRPRPASPHRTQWHRCQSRGPRPACETGSCRAKGHPNARRSGQRVHADRGWHNRSPVHTSRSRTATGFGIARMRRNSSSFRQLPRFAPRLALDHPDLLPDLARQARPQQLDVGDRLRYAFIRHRLRIQRRELAGQRQKLRAIIEVPRHPHAHPGRARARFQSA